MCVCACVCVYVLECIMHTSVYSAHACRHTDVLGLSAVLVLWCLHSRFAFLYFLCSGAIGACVSMYLYVCVCQRPRFWSYIQTYNSIRVVSERDKGCAFLSFCVHDYILDLKSILTNKLWVFFCYSEQFLVLCQYFLHLLGWGRKRMGAETEEVILLMRVTLIPWLVHCCRFISPAFALQLYHFSPLLSPYVLLWMKNLPRVPASAMSCILLSPSISVDIFTSLYTPTVTRPCTGRRSIKIVPSNRPMNCE